MRDRGRADFIDIVDRVLDKGVIVDAIHEISVGGISVMSVRSRAVISSLDTYVRRAEELRAAGLPAPPAPEPQRLVRALPAPTSAPKRPLRLPHRSAAGEQRRLREVEDVRAALARIRAIQARLGMARRG